MTSKAKKVKPQTARDFMPTDKIVNVDSIEVDDTRNVRDLVVNKDGEKVYEDVTELARQIKSEGLIQPPVLRAVKPGHPDPAIGYELWVGFRRIAAVKLNKIKQISARVYPADTPDEVMYLMNIAENVQRKNLKPYETAARCAFLCDEMNLSGRDIARRLGKSQTYVSDLLRCWNFLHPEIKDIWKTGDRRATTDRLVKDILVADPVWLSHGKAAGEPWRSIDHEKQWELWEALVGKTKGSGDGDGKGEGDGGGGDDKPAPRASAKKLVEEYSRVERLLEYHGSGKPIAHDPVELMAYLKALGFALGRVECLIEEADEAPAPGSEKTPAEVEAERKLKIAKDAAAKKEKAAKAGTKAKKNGKK